MFLLRNYELSEMLFARRSCVTARRCHSPLCLRDGLRSVSYTHLDVYKRQAPAPKEPRQPTTTPRPDNGIMYRVPPPTPRAPSTEEGSSDPTFADRLRVCVETLIPPILAAKDVQSLLVTILTSLMTLLPLNV